MTEKELLIFKITRLIDDKHNFVAMSPDDLAEVLTDIVEISGEGGEGSYTNEEAIQAVKAEGITIEQGYHTPKLTNWYKKLVTSPSTAKLLFVGDSTSVLANTTLHTLLDKYTATGDVLAGYNIANTINYGSNGDSIQNFYDNPNGALHLNSVIAENPDLIIFSYGINDVRINSLTKEQLKNYVINCVEAFREALPDCDIILRMPNSFLIPATDVLIKKGVYDSLAQAAQAHTDILYYAYKELENYWDNVVVFDSQNLVWGRTSVSSSPMFIDEIHPNQEYAIPELLKLIGYKLPYSRQKSIAALYTASGTPASTYSTPWTVYPRVLEHEDNFIKICEGLYNTQGTNYLDISLSGFIGAKNAYEALGKVKQGDIVSINDEIIFIIPASATFTASTSTVFRISGSSLTTAKPSNNITKGFVKIYRNKYNNTFATEQYLNDKKTYPYRRKVNIASCGNGYMIIDNMLDSEDGLTKYDPHIKVCNLNLTTSDVIVAEGLTPLVLSGATFSWFNGTESLRIDKSGDMTAYQGKVAYIFGNHPYEVVTEKQFTAAGITGNQTINKQSGTVNIAAGGTTITVTNSYVKIQSIVQAVIRTNDSTAVIKNVVCSNGSFTINLSSATTAETSIGFIVFC